MAIDFRSVDDVIGRELLLLIERAKYERFVLGETSTLVTREFERMVDLLVSGRFRDLTAAQRTRAAQLFQALDRQLQKGYAGIAEFHVKEMQGYAKLEADVARLTAAAVVPDAGIALGVHLPKTFLESIARLPIQGLSIGDWFDAQASSMSLATKRVIQQGLVEGIGPLAIAPRILAPQRSAGAAINKRALNEARVVSRTVVNAVQNSAQMAGLESLPDDVSDSYVYEAVLDKSTTPICRALSGRVYKYTDPKRQMPPKHVGCRSTIRALIKGAEELMQDQREPRTVRNYDTWLKTQTITVQNEILGPTRAQWWRDGKMTLADAIDADNRILTLPQLRARLGLS